MKKIFYKLVVYFGGLFVDTYYCMGSTKIQPEYQIIDKYF